MTDRLDTLLADLPVIDDIGRVKAEMRQYFLRGEFEGPAHPASERIAAVRSCIRETRMTGVHKHPLWKDFVRWGAEAVVGS